MSPKPPKSPNRQTSNPGLLLLHPECSCRKVARRKQYHRKQIPLLWIILWCISCLCILSPRPNQQLLNGRRPLNISYHLAPVDTLNYVCLLTGGVALGWKVHWPRVLEVRSGPWAKLLCSFWEHDQEDGMDDLCLLVWCKEWGLWNQKTWVQIILVIFTICVTLDKSLNSEPQFLYL